MELKDLHEEVFKFLLEKRKADPSLRYTLRGVNGKTTNEKKDKGLWFLEGSTSETLYFSFWDAYSDGNKFAYPIIRFEINTNKKCVLRIRNPNSEHKDLWNNIAYSLDLVNKTDNEWEKEYKKGHYFKDDLEQFISFERPYLNSIFKVKGVESEYPPISEVDFLTKFDNIQAVRENLEERKLSVFLSNKLIVEQLHLDNINAFKTLYTHFNEHVTCFVGGNGSGKTTILRSIALGLVGFSELKTIPNLLAIKESKSETIYAESGKVQVDYYYNGANFISPYSFYSVEKGRALSDTIHDGTKTALIADEGAFKALIIGFAQQSYAEPKLSTRRRPNISDLEALIMNKPDNRFEEFLQWFQAGLNQDLTESKAFRTLISKIISIINNCIRKEEGDTTNDIDFVGITNINLKTQQNPKGIPIDKLSQGYRNLLGWVGFFAKRMHEYHLTLIEDGILSENVDFLQLPAVCLIDEIDTYLHPDWQYSILKGLVDSFPNVQFIITSHSPFVLTSVPSDKITIYDLHTEGGEIVVREIEENLSGADANRATDKISSHRSKRPLKLFKLLQNHIDNNRLDDAEQILNQLIEDEKVDENRDLEILRAKRLIRTKKLLQSTKPVTL